MSEALAAYQPGVCNINHAEIARRRRMGHTGLAVFVILLIVLLAIGISAYYRITLFLPAVLAASGYLQARNHFCVGYAGAGMQNAEEGSTQAGHITDQAAVAQDKRKARIMNLQTIVIAFGATAIACALPRF